MPGLEAFVSPPRAPSYRPFRKGKGIVTMKTMNSIAAIIIVQRWNMVKHRVERHAKRVLGCILEAEEIIRITTKGQEVTSFRLQACGGLQVLLTSAVFGGARIKANVRGYMATFKNDGSPAAHWSCKLAEAEEFASWLSSVDTDMLISAWAKTQAEADDERVIYAL